MKSSIAKLMIVVAMAAINAFLIRTIVGSRHEGWLNPLKGEVILLGLMPMADLLAFAVLFRAEGQRFLDGFLVAGGCVLALSIGLVAIVGVEIDLLLVRVVQQFIPSLEMNPVTLFWRCSVAVTLLLAVQLPGAAMGGSFWSARRRVDQCDDRSNSRTSMGMYFCRRR